MPNKPKSNDKIEDKDLFHTPRYATRLLLPFLKPYTTVWECAAGTGNMVGVLETQHAVWGSDIWVPDPETLHPGDYEFEQWDFLERTKNDVWMKQINYIVTNPPYTKKIKFYQKCMYYWRQCGTPFALLIPADYAGWVINAVHEDMCQKIIPTRRIDFLTPDMLARINTGEGTNYKALEEVPASILYRYTSSKFHSMWLTKGLDIQIPKPVLPSEIYVNLSLKSKKEDI